MKTRKAHLHCHKQYSNRDPDRIELEIKDSASHHIVAQIHLTLEDFGRLISGETLDDCDVDWHDTEHIGWISTNEDHEVLVPDGYDRSDTKGKAAVEAKRLELEAAEPGVVVSARSGDVGNMHRRAKGDYGEGMCAYNVVFWTLRPPEVAP